MADTNPDTPSRLFQEEYEGWEEGFRRLVLVSYWSLIDALTAFIGSWLLYSLLAYQLCQAIFWVAATIGISRQAFNPYRQQYSEFLDTPTCIACVFLGTALYGLATRYSLSFISKQFWTYHSLTIFHKYVLYFVVPSLARWMNGNDSDVITSAEVMLSLYRMFLFIWPFKTPMSILVIATITFAIFRACVVQGTSINKRLIQASGRAVSKVLGLLTRCLLGVWHGLRFLALKLEEAEAQLSQALVGQLPEYCYHPLGERTTRLLRIHRRWPFRGLECDVITISVDDPPEYEAVSHAWGDRQSFVTMKVDSNFHMRVPVRLYRLLRHRRSYMSTKFLWIGALSIDQNHLEEKAAQVKMMKDVFGNATRVTLWLAASEEAPDAGLVQSYLLKVRTVYNIGYKRSPEILAPNIEPSEEIKSAMRRFLDNKYWQRLWMVQEVSLARKIVCVYGATNLGWWELAPFHKLLLNPMCNVPTQYLIVGPVTDAPALQRVMILRNIESMAQTRIRVQEDREQRKKMLVSPLQSGISSLSPDNDSTDPMYWPLEIMLASSTLFHVTDPRDRIFAVTGAVQDPDAYLPEPDYILPFEVVYHRAIANLLVRGRHPEILFAMAGVGLGGRVLSDSLPSWLPDFNINSLHFTAVTITKTFSWWQDPSIIKMTPELDALTVQACVVDGIASIGPVQADSTGRPYMSDQVTSDPLFLKSLSVWLEDTTQWAEQSHLHHCETQGHIQTKMDRLSFYRALLVNRYADVTPIPERVLHEVEGTIETIHQAASSDVKIYDDPKLVVKKLNEEWRLGSSRSSTSMGRRMRFTEYGRFVMAPPLVRAGDFVCFFQNMRNTFLLRPVEYLKGRQKTNHGRRVYQLVGCCYAEGVEYENECQDFEEIELV